MQQPTTAQDHIPGNRIAAFALCNALIISAVSLRYLAVTTVSSSAMASIYVLLAWLGHGFLLALPALALIALTGIISRGGKPQTVIAVLATVVVLAAVIIDTVVYQQFRFHIDGAVLAMLSSGSIIEFLSLTPRQLGGIAVLLIALAALEFGLWRATAAVRLAPFRKHSRRGLYLLAACWVTGNLLFAWSSAVRDVRVTSLYAVLPWQQPVTMNRLARRFGLAEDTAMNLDRPVEGPLNYPLAPVQCSTDTSLNLLVILVDAWRIDALNAKVMPATSRFAANALQFNRHFSPSSSTRGGVFSLFYGLPPSYWLDVFNQGVEPVMMRCLRDAGYQFSIHASAALTNPEFDRTVFRGLEDFDRRTPGDSASERDAEITRRFSGFLEKRDSARPFFGFLFYDAAHAYDVPDGKPWPFQPSWTEPDYLALQSGTDPVPFMNLYRNAMYYIDQEIAEVLAALRDTGQLDDTIVIITGDHAQEFNDNGLNYWGHNSNFSPAQTQVPLLIHWPGKPAATISHLTTHYDLSATLLPEMFDVAEPIETYTEGRNLFSPAPRLPLLMANYVEQAMKYGDGYLLVDRYHRLHQLGEDYRALPDARIEPDDLKRLLEKRARFLETP